MRRCYCYCCRGLLLCWLLLLLLLLECRCLWCVIIIVRTVACEHIHADLFLVISDTSIKVRASAGLPAGTTMKLNWNKLSLCVWLACTLSRLTSQVK